MKDDTYKKMRIFRIFLSATVLVALASAGYGQKLKSDGYRLTVKSFERRQMGFHGKGYAIYKGSIKVGSKNDLKGMYLFSFIELGDSISSLSFKNSAKQTLRPKLIFDSGTRTFSYFRRTDVEGSQKIEGGLSEEETVLAGMLIWLRLKEDAP